MSYRYQPQRASNEYVQQCTAHEHVFVVPRTAMEISRSRAPLSVSSRGPARGNPCSAHYAVAAARRSSALRLAGTRRHAVRIARKFLPIQRASRRRRRCRCGKAAGKRVYTRSAARGRRAARKEFPLSRRNPFSPRVQLTENLL